MDVKISLHLFLLVLFFAIPGGTTLKCYACYSPLGGPCAVSPTDVNVEDCREDNPRCYLVTQTKENPKFVQRGCTSGPKCPSLPGDNECTLCNNKDTCNDLVIPKDDENNNGTSLKCYSCLSLLGGPCAVNPTHAKVEDCKEDNPGCYLVTQTKGNPKFVQRGCTSGPNCPSIPWDNECTLCNNTDTCNDLVIPKDDENNNGTSLKCYSCHSPLGGPCAVNPTQTNVEDCKENNPRCYLITQTKKDPKFVQRGCTSGPKCPSFPENIECTLCNNKDTCNDLIIPNDNENNNGTSLKCYTCESPLGGPCAVNLMHVNVEDCKEDNPRCYLVTQTKENAKVVQRGCTSASKCPCMPWHNECSSCDKNTCNDNVIPNNGENNGNNNGNVE